jgi:peptidyl-prolyl cis-trans isomerase SurA
VAARSDSPTDADRHCRRGGSVQNGFPPYFFDYVFSSSRHAMQRPAIRKRMMKRASSALFLGLAMALAALSPAMAAGVRLTVDGTPISDVQIQQRAKLLALEHHGGNLQKAAEDELVNEILENEDAKRYNITVSNSDVDAAFTSMAQGLRISPDKLTQVLVANGVGTDTLRARIRATLAFNKITQNVIAPRVTISEAALNQQARGKLTAVNSYDYILKQVLFLPHKGQGPGARMGDAQRYRARFKGCDSAVSLSASFMDAAVTDVGRRNAMQLDPKMAAQLSSLPVGGITRPQVQPDGVSMLAICQKNKSNDLTFLTNQLRAKQGNDQLKTETDKYLADLKAKAVIVTH